jgi:two-component system chemotaxis response regulator CheB
MPNRDIIVIGASAGGVAALAEVVGSLPAGLPASVFAVCHFPSEARSRLPEILSRSGVLLASHAVDGESFYPGHIYIAPPDHHLLLGPEMRMRLSHGPRENLNRPAIDPLFRSAARYYGTRAIGVILSGALSDGTAGLMALRAGGGVGVIQDPDDASAAEMPRNAALIAGADYTVPLRRIGRLLAELVHSKGLAKSGATELDPIERMPGVVNGVMRQQTQDLRKNDVSVFTCPECGGTLWQVDETQPLRFRCHVGHAYEGEILFAEKSEALEAAMWTAVRTFREKSVLARQLANRERQVGKSASAARFDERAEQADRYGSLLEGVLLNESFRGINPESTPAQMDLDRSTGGGHA